MKVFLDLDGILINFIKGACQLHHKNYDEVMENWPLGAYSMESAICLSPSEFWKPLGKHEFWATLPWMNDGNNILRILEKYFGKDNIAICTAPTHSPYSASGKMEWIWRELPEYYTRFFIGPTKYFCASEDAILIDDAEYNIVPFKERGGQAFLYPRRWNDSYKDENKGLELLEEFIKGIKKDV